MNERAALASVRSAPGMTARGALGVGIGPSRNARLRRGRGRGDAAWTLAATSVASLFTLDAGLNACRRAVQAGGA